MSKPNPQLSRGIVRTLAREVGSQTSSYPSGSHILTLAPVVFHPSSSSSSTLTTTTTPPLATGSSKVVYGPHLPPSSTTTTTTSASTSSAPWSLPLPLQSLGSSSYLSLLPSWETIGASSSLPSLSSQVDHIVLPYRPSSSSSSSLRSSINTSRSIHTHPHSSPRHVSRRYSTAASSPASSFLTSSQPPSFFTPTQLAPNVTPSQSSLDELIASLELSSLFFGKPAGRGDGQAAKATEPPFQNPPSPGPSSSPGSQHPMKPPRPAETHTVLSPAPLPPNDSGSNGPAPFASYPSLAALAPPSSELTTPDTTAANALTTSAYSSSLIFHLGASGLPKERLPLPPPSSAGRSRPPAPPRQRSFALPDVTAPTQFHSISVGEDAYFARLDGMCIADGVGGWTKSGAGGADPGRWSRLLTHFCEEEVGDWWAGAEVYLVDSTKNDAESKSTSGGQNQKDGSTRWADAAWDKSAGHAHTNSNDQKATETAQEGRIRRPLNPVEIMQRGYEKCLACVTSEGVLGSSTCLLALLHNSTLHIANLGDCCLLLIRQGEVVFRTSEMQHAFNFPLQVGTHSRDEPMKDAMRFDVPVKKGDIVVLGSDGLMDNLFDEDILDVVAQFTTPSEPLMPTLPPTPPNSRPSSSSSQGGPATTKTFSSNAKPSPSASSGTLPFPPFSPQRVSEALCRRARAVSELVTATTPFMCKAIEEGIDFVGGKKDDISVLVGVVGDRQSEQLVNPADARGPAALALHT